MQNLRSLIPVGLFLAFAVSHYMATQGNQSRVTLLVANSPGTVREPFTGDLVTSTTILVEDPDSDWLQQFVKEDDLGSIVGESLKRSLQPGQLLQFKDFREPRVGLTLLEPGYVGLQLEVNVEIVPGHIWVGNNVGFVILRMDDSGQIAETKLRQPFRIISIGEFRESERGSEEVTARHNRRLITVAAKLEDDETLEERYNELIHASNEQDNLRISNLVILSDQEL